MNANVKIFAENIEQGALEDIEALAASPVNSGKQLRFMPDCHKGVTVPIGTTVPVDLVNPEEAINPGTVGCDIGCTVSALFFDAPMFPDKMAVFEHKIRKEIPFGFAINDRSNYERKAFYKEVRSSMNRLVSQHPELAGFAIPFNCDQDAIAWCRKIGISEKMFFDSLPSVGGGNHFGCPEGLPHRCPHYAGLRRFQPQADPREDFGHLPQALQGAGD